MTRTRRCVPCAGRGKKRADRDVRREEGGDLHDLAGTVGGIPGPRGDAVRPGEGAGAAPGADQESQGALPAPGPHPHVVHHGAGGQGAGRAHRTLLRQGVSQKCQIHGIEEGGALPRTWRCITARWPRTTTRS